MVIRRERAVGVMLGELGLGGVSVLLGVQDAGLASDGVDISTYCLNLK